MDRDGTEMSETTEREKMLIQDRGDGCEGDEKEGTDGVKRAPVHSCLTMEKIYLHISTETYLLK